MRGSRALYFAVALSLLLGSVFAPGLIDRAARSVSAAAPASARPAALPAPPKRLLVIVPHPDDESLGGTTLIARTLAHGGVVRLVVMTNGDGFRLAAAKAFGVRHPQAHDLFRLGLVRQREELAAAHVLGLSARDVQFLGYPDGGMHQLLRTEHWTAQWPYRALNGNDHVPYRLALHQGAPYCGQAVVQDLRQVFATFQPTDVLFPDPHDIHNDHWASSAFTQYVLAEQRHPPHAFTYLIHYPNYPVPRLYRPLRSLDAPHSLVHNGMTWLHLPVTKRLEARKKRAILSHRTQIHVMHDLLLSFVRTNELIARYKPDVVQSLPVRNQKISDLQQHLHLPPTLQPTIQHTTHFEASERQHPLDKTFWHTLHILTHPHSFSRQGRVLFIYQKYTNTT